VTLGMHPGLDPRDRGQVVVAAQTVCRGAPAESSGQTMSPGDGEPGGLMERAVKLAYDVGVNTVANLIAAAILYMLGTWVGLLPSDPQAILAATLLLVAGCLLLLMLALTVRAVRRQRQGHPQGSPRPFGLLVLLLGFWCLYMMPSTPSTACREQGR
jgi:hypothetical protein